MTNHIDDISQRKSAIIVGALILIAYIMVGSFYFGSLIIVMLLELISAAAMIAMGFLMFPILKPHNKNLALGYVVCRIIDGLIFIIAGISFGIGMLVMNFITAEERIPPNTHLFIDSMNRKLFMIRGDLFTLPNKKTHEFAIDKGYHRIFELLKLIDIFFIFKKWNDVIKLLDDQN